MDEGKEVGREEREERDGVRRKTEGCKQYTCFLEMTMGWQHITSNTRTNVHTLIILH